MFLTYIYLIRRYHIINFCFEQIMFLSKHIYQEQLATK